MTNSSTNVHKKLSDKVLDFIEKSGNLLPDPAMMFFFCLVLVWILSAIFSNFSFTEIDPRTGTPLLVNNLLEGKNLAKFLSQMVSIFVNFVPLGVVLVAILGVGVAENSGFVSTGLKLLLRVTPKKLLTPMLIVLSIASHSAIDAGYIVMVPLGAVIFYAAGRHPLAGMAAAIAGTAGGFSANFVPSALDAMLQGFTQTAANIIDPEKTVNILSNYYFTSSSTILIVAIGWFLTDKIVEPRLAKIKLNDEIESDSIDNIEPKQKRAFYFASGSVIILLAGLVVALLPGDSPLRDTQGQITSFTAPIMQSIVPIIFILFVVPGIIYGYMVGKFKKTKDVVDSMTKSMEGMAYYVVISFFAALFIDAFGKSNLGALLALKGATILNDLAVPGVVTVVSIVFLTAFINMFVGSASAKWALLSPIFVPMLMQLGLSPELTQAAYRVGDSATNIITPLNPYLPLFVVFAKRYVKSTGIGTIISMMFPYSISFLVLWTLFLILFWMVGLPLGIEASYVYP
ncbi:MAG: AbgT family transporter [Ignavibacteriaceae bacterium]|nr:AbgT family transporter [Ignavibacteriaceae bacterium]